MKPTVGLINTYSTLNIGDAAIYSALTHLADQARVLGHFQDAVPEFIPGLQIVPKLPECQAYISVGGDIFNNARENFITKTFLKNLWQLQHSPQRTFLFGQSIPRSCHGLSFQALAWCLRRLAAVCVRDAESHQRLLRAGVPAILSYDTAFALEVSEADKQAAQQVFQTLDVDPANATLISLRSFDAMYGHDNQQFLALLVSLCQQLLAKGEQPVLLIQSQAYGTDNDLDMAAAIVQQVPQTKIFDPFAVTSSLSRWQLVMGGLAIARQIVAIRYHTAVLALACGRVPFNLYYSNKGRDLSQRLNIPGGDLSEFDPAAALPTLAEAGAAHFDHAKLRQQVQEDFQTCWGRVNP